MVVLLSVLVLLIGLVIYIFNTKTPGNPVWAEVGRIMFFAGLLAFLLQSDKVIALLSTG